MLMKIREIPFVCGAGWTETRRVHGDHPECLLPRPAPHLVREESGRRPPNGGQEVCYCSDIHGYYAVCYRAQLCVCVCVLD